MTLSGKHLSITLLIALVLHGAVAMWLAVPKPAPPPLPPKQAIRINLLAAVSEKKVDAPVAPPETPEPSPTLDQVTESIPEPAPEPIPKSIPEPLDQPEPEMPELVPEPKLAAEPIPKEVLPAENIPEPLPEPEVQEALAEPELPLETPVPEVIPEAMPEPEIQAVVAEQVLAEIPISEPPALAPKIPANKIETKPKPVPQEIVPEPPQEPVLEVQKTQWPEQTVENVVEEVVSSEALEEAVSQVPTDAIAEPSNPLATAQYEQALVSWLKKHKKYPRRARRLRIEGEGVLHIRIDREGRLQSVTLEQSTGNRLLDKAALEIARRADPFPPMPPHDLRQEMAFFVPVVFALR